MMRLRQVFVTTSVAFLVASGFSGVGHSQVDEQGRRNMQEFQKRFKDKLEYTKWLTRKGFLKAGGENPYRKEILMNGNQIATRVFNYGSISTPGEGMWDIRWKGMGYAYEFGPLVAAEVVDANGQTVHIVTDGLIDNGDVAPDGSKRWGWEPLPGYADPDQPFIASADALDNDGPDGIPNSGDDDGKPDSWPESWYVPHLQRYVWPGVYAKGATQADKEIFYVMDDRNNEEFAYYPFPDDSSRRGLGLQVEVRAYQWTSPLAEDCIFITYQITNVSPKPLHKVYFGMWGDPHVGGYNDFSDDNAFFDKKVDMVYAWDADNKPGAGFVGTPGYFGYKFLESPGNPHDGIDNDEDGMVDEDITNGIDDDHDWNPLTDDVGADGLPDTGDEGEGDGVPTAGEPNFDLTDLDEADQIGLTSFTAFLWSSHWVREDEYIWNQLAFVGFGEIEQNADNVFLYGSGPIALYPGETQRFGIALLLGENKDDLFLNAETVQRIYNAGYRFTRPPLKPHVTAVPGDGQVTLYWDSIAEESVDDITGKDFEGYVIYRSTDFTFQDITTITDINGSKFLAQPLVDELGNPAKWDLINGWKGLHPVAYPGRGIHYNLGNNTGLVHQYTDRTVKNGVTYYYAVVSYDHGDSLGTPPTECSKSITLDRGRLSFDVNTVEVTPNAPAAGYVPPEVPGGLEHVEGPGTGTVTYEILDPMAVEDGNLYRLSFSDTVVTLKGEARKEKNYSVRDLKPVQERFFAKVGGFIGLRNAALIPGTVKIEDKATGRVFTEGVDYNVNYLAGKILGLPGGALEDRKAYDITYEYYPVFQSTLLDAEDANPVFDGVKIRVKDEKAVALDPKQTGWIRGGTRPKLYDYQVKLHATGIPYPADYEIRFASTIIDTSDSPSPAIPPVPVPFTVWNVTENRSSRFVLVDKRDPKTKQKGSFSSGDEIVILNSPNPRDFKSSWNITFSDTTGDTTGVVPSEGDVFLVHTLKPFQPRDVFEFRTKAPSMDMQAAKGQLDRIAVVPNPYVVTAIWEPRQELLTAPRERKLEFIHLPPRCTIRIYTITGELVDTIEHDSPINDGSEFWDLLTKDSMSIAYGIYIYHVEAPGIGERIGRFAVIK